MDFHLKLITFNNPTVEISNDFFSSRILMQTKCKVRLKCIQCKKINKIEWKIDEIFDIEL